MNQKKAEAEPGYLRVLERGGRSDRDWKVPASCQGWTRTSMRRAALANWMTDTAAGAGSLAARVIVNRLWQHHLGRGIVATPSDFGEQGEPPSHPELLDWLAFDLRPARLGPQAIAQDDRDRVRCTCKIVDLTKPAPKIDRENVFRWRYTPRRLEAEPIRDVLLAFSGRLDSSMFGAGTLDPNMRRRSVYFFIKRSQLIPSMMLFDWPEHLVGIGQRASTTTAPQALMFMNSPLGRASAEGLAARVSVAEPGLRERDPPRLQACAWAALPAPERDSPGSGFSGPPAIDLLGRQQSRSRAAAPWSTSARRC